MARVLVLTADLLFGSRVQGQLQAAGEQVELVADARRTGELLEEESSVALLVVDLTDAKLGGIELVDSLPLERRPPTLGVYAHVEADVRERAERAGFDLVVPRSRFAREGAALVSRLAESSRR
jgi:CheY-like chemotaxis protein